jgi:hypothetical protein
MQTFHNQMVVSHHHVEATIQYGSILEFVVRVSSSNGRNCGIEGRRVPQTRVKISCGKCRWHSTERSRTRQSGAEHRLCFTPLVRKHLPRGVDLGPGDVAVHVHSARHDDHPRHVNDHFSAVCRVCRSRDAATILHPDVTQFTVNPVPGIINHSALQAGSAHSEFSADCCWLEVRAVTCRVS